MPLRVHILVAVMLLSVCVRAHAEQESQDVVAVVNGEAVGREEFGRALVGSLGRNAMESFVDLALLEQEARRRGVAVSDGELAARRELEVELRLRAVPQAARMGPGEFRLAADRLGWDMAERRRALQESISDNVLRGRLLAEKMLAPELDLGEEALRAYFERTRGMGYAAAHIVLGSRRQARELLEVLEADLGLWERAVLQYSLDRPSVPYKGRIGPVPAGSELGRALADMEPGELKLWQQGDAWHVLRFIRAVPGADEAFEEVTDRLRAELTVVECSRRYQALLAELHRDADVVVNLPGDPAARPLLGEDVAAYVNGEPLMMGELADVLIEEFGDLMLEAYVERLLIEQEAERRGLAVSEEEVGERMAAIADQLVAEQAGRQGMTMAELEGSPTGADTEAADLRAGLLRQFVSRRDVEATLLAERMVAPGVEVTEADIAEAYGDLGRDRFVVEELATDSVPAAERMHRRVQEGLSFELVARTELAEPGAWVQGGLRGVVSSAHPYYVYVKDLREGEVSGVFKEGGQYRIIRVLRRDPPSDPPPLESVRETLAQEVRLRKSRARIRALLVRLKAEADVEVRPN